MEDNGQPVMYDVAVTTGSVKNAGTDARVFIKFIGKQGESKEERLQADKASFEQGKTDVFKVRFTRMQLMNTNEFIVIKLSSYGCHLLPQIQANDVGELKAIKIRHDNTGIGAGWFLEKVMSWSV